MGTHSNRVAVVTGCAQGLGREYALVLAQRGADMVLIDLEEPTEIAAEIEALGRKVLSLKMDASSESDWASAAAAIKGQFGGAHILVNNAGIYPWFEFDSITHDDWNRVMRVNLDSVFHATKHIAPMMGEAGWGRIVNIASGTVATNLPNMTAYMTSKMAVIGATRGFANDLADRGITVNAVAVGLIATPGTADLAPEIWEYSTQTQAIRRPGQPADVAGTVAYLTSDDSAFVTGQTISVDGGKMRL